MQLGHEVQRLHINSAIIINKWFYIRNLLLLYPQVTRIGSNLVVVLYIYIYIYKYIYLCCVSVVLEDTLSDL